MNIFNQPRLCEQTNKKKYIFWFSSPHSTDIRYEYINFNGNRRRIKEQTVTVFSAIFYIHKQKNKKIAVTMQ